MNRRTVLKYGLGGAALLTFGGVGLSIRSGVLRSPTKTLRIFSDMEFSVLAAIADRIVPSVDGFPSATHLQVAERIDGLMAISIHENAKEFKQVLRLVENALVSLLMGGPPTPFTALSGPEQDAVLVAWRDSRLSVRRTAFSVLRTVCLSTYFSHPEANALVGYPGPPDLSSLTLDEPLTVGAAP